MSLGRRSGLTPFIAACRSPSLRRCRYSTSTTTVGRTHTGGTSPVPGNRPAGSGTVLAEPKVLQKRVTLICPRT